MAKNEDFCGHQRGHQLAKTEDFFMATDTLRGQKKRERPQKRRAPGRPSYDGDHAPLCPLPQGPDPEKQGMTMSCPEHRPGEDDIGIDPANGGRG